MTCHFWQELLVGVELRRLLDNFLQFLLSPQLFECFYTITPSLMRFSHFSFHPTVSTLSHINYSFLCVLFLNSVYTQFYVNNSCIIIAIIYFYPSLQKLHTVKNLSFALTKSTSCSHALSDDNLDTEVYLQSK